MNVLENESIYLEAGSFLKVETDFLLFSFFRSNSRAFILPLDTLLSLCSVPLINLRTEEGPEHVKSLNQLFGTL